MNRKKFLLLIFIFLSFLSFSSDNSSDKKIDKFLSDNILDISIEPGAGFYVGDFYNHLVKKGAYFSTPTLDIYLSVYFLKYFGISAMVGSGCIIHPRSYPIEGTVIYMGLELFGQYDFKYLYLKIFSGAGFQHTTMLIQYYASAFFEVGTGLGVKITDYIYWYTTFKFRMGFLHSVLLYYWYDLDSNDTLMSVTVPSGISVRIKKSK